MVQGIRAVEASLGSATKTVGRSEARNRVAARRSLVALQPIEQGALFTADNLGAKRPGDGVSPMRHWDVLGQAAPRAFETDEPIVLDDLSAGPDSTSGESGS